MRIAGKLPQLGIFHGATTLITAHMCLLMFAHAKLSGPGLAAMRRLTGTRTVSCAALRYVRMSVEVYHVGCAGGSARIAVDI